MDTATPRMISYNEWIDRREAARILEAAYNEATFHALQRETRALAIPIMGTMHRAWRYVFCESIKITETELQCVSTEPHGGARCCYPTGHRYSHGTGGHNSISW